MMILVIKRIGPLGESLLGKGKILCDSTLRQSDEVPPPRVRMTDQDQRHSLSGSE